MDEYEFSYTCHSCGVERFVKAPWRKPAETIIQYIDVIIMPAIARDHREASPRCMARSCDLKLPLADDNTAIGVKPSPSDANKP